MKSNSSEDNEAGEVEKECEGSWASKTAHPQLGGCKLGAIFILSVTL